MPCGKHSPVKDAQYEYTCEVRPVKNHVLPLLHSTEAGLDVVATATKERIARQATTTFLNGA